MHANHPDSVCATTFDSFTYQPLQAASPPASKGVYVIRISRPGAPIPDVFRASKAAIERLRWPMVEKHAVSRLDRVARIADCPILDIGSAGTAESSKHTLKGRYEDFGGRHTIMFPLWSLLFHEWELEYGWVADSAAAQLEIRLKSRYRDIHEGKLPALVSR